ncbi:MAG: sugar transporter [Alphaproteobacteria bacterium]|nr:MAG: sugar transporter [Alphaproteobacteria bacterium]
MVETTAKHARTAAAYLKRQKPFFWVIVIWLVCLVYYVGLASNRYAPEARVYVKSIGGDALDSMPSVASLALGGGGSSQDLRLLADYLHSRDLMLIVDEKLGVRAHYADKQWDFISRLSDNASDEDFLKYFRSHVLLNVDDQSGILSVRALGFTPAFSKDLTEELLRQGEGYINRVGQDIAARQVLFVESELDRAKAELADASEKLLRFQIENHTLSPQAEGQSYQSIIADLRAELVKLRSEEKAQLSYLNERAPEMVALRARIAAIESQLKVEQARVAGENDNKSSIGELQLDYQALDLQREFAFDLYKATFTTLEKTRVDAYRKLKHLVVVQSASLPEDELYPRRAYNLLTIFVLLSLAYGIMSLVVAIVKEHRDV